MKKATKTGAREEHEAAVSAASALRELAVYAPSGEAELLEALACIRNREGVKLQRHADAGGLFVDYFIDDLVDRLYRERA
jgi:hypothetical protein